MNCRKCKKPMKHLKGYSELAYFTCDSCDELIPDYDFKIEAFNRMPKTKKIKDKP